MKKKAIICYLFILLTFHVNAKEIITLKRDDKILRYVKNEILIHFSEGSLNNTLLEKTCILFNKTEGENNKIFNKKSNIVTDLISKSTKIRKLFSNSKPSNQHIINKSGKSILLPDFHNILHITTDDSVDIMTMCKILKSDDNIISASPNYLLQEKSSWEPNDNKYYLQQSLKKIGMDEAWNLEKGNASIVVGIIDSGVDKGHPDLESKILKRHKYGSGDIDKDHGTSVAGIVNAKSNNLIGIAGIADCNIKVFNVATISGGEQGYEYDDMAEALYDAATNGNGMGCDVINFSLGGSDIEDLEILISAFQAAALNDLVVCCSKGNSNTNKLHYPSDLYDSFVLSVGASDATDGRYVGDFWGSNYGNSMDLLAPGQKNQIYTTKPNKDYDHFSGTSAAAPHVAGVAALILSKDPKLHSEDVEEIICRTAYKVPDMNSNNYTEEHGYGRLDAYQAVNFLNENNIHYGFKTGGVIVHTGDLVRMDLPAIGGLSQGTYILQQYTVEVDVSVPELSMVWFGL